MWVLETEPGSFARGTNVLNCGPISPAPIITYFYSLILMGIVFYELHGSGHVAPLVESLHSMHEVLGLVLSTP